MKKLFSCLTAAALLMLTNVVLAVPKTVTLDVPGMTCSACPITVKKALMKDRKSTRLNSSHIQKSRMPSSA